LVLQRRDKLILFDIVLNMAQCWFDYCNVMLTLAMLV
jgi:hypothetical protein